AVPDQHIAAVFAVMAATPHTYQILTKRHGRMRSLVAGDLYDLMVTELSDLNEHASTRRPHGLRWPLPNVWLGVSVESQQWADIPVPVLLHTPPPLPFLSSEPPL